jgi:hypothetical protein
MESGTTDSIYRLVTGATSVRHGPVPYSHKDFKNYISKICIASYDTANNVREYKAQNMSLKASA